MLRAMEASDVEDGLHLARGGEGGRQGAQLSHSPPLSALPERARAPYSPRRARGLADPPPPPSAGPRRRRPARAPSAARTSTAGRPLPTVRLRVLTRGGDDSLPVLVYPPFAWTFPTIASGDRLFLRLAPHFLMMTYDPRGVGGSRSTPRASSMDDYVSDVVGMAEYARRRFGKDKVYALGTSTGATLVALAAQRAPHRLRTSSSTAPPST